MCLFPDQLRELLSYLESGLSGLGISCDHTLSRTLKWIEGANLDAGPVVAGLREFGGTCDCEVLLNVTPDKFGWPE